MEKAAGQVPDAAHFDVGRLSADFPLIARIGAVGPDQKLHWRDVPDAAHWPFGPPVKDRPVAETIPPLSVKRVVSAFKETLESGIPDYFETTSWMHGGQTVSLARLVAPIAAGAGRELIALWEVLEPPSAS